MLSRLVSLILVLVILVGGGYLIYKFFKGPTPSTTKTLTINKDGKFASNNFKLNNNEVFVIKNNSGSSQTIKKVSDNATVVEVASGETSRELTLNQNSKVSLYLASHKEITTTVVVGNPSTTTQTQVTQTPPKTTTPVNAQKTQPLPNTGPGDNYLYLAIVIVGFLLVKLSSFYWKYRVVR